MSLPPCMDVTRLPSWQRLDAHARALSGLHLRAAFRADPDRHRRFSIETDDVFLDWSKNRVTDETVGLLEALADETGLAEAVDALFSGAAVNVTENRPALHMALRAEPGPDALGRAIAAVHRQMAEAVEALHAAAVTGATGAAITDLVSIGIGGSHLGPCLAVRALDSGASSPVRVHFCANLDGHDLHALLGRLDPNRTLFLVASKSFTTLETFANARAARDWMQSGLPAGADLGRHFWAVTANVDAAREFGIAPERIFAFWDWVGGRYSLWSAIGLPIAVALGMDAFRGLLAGAAAMDRHFRTAPVRANLPTVMGLLAVWNSNFLGAATHAVVPYDQRLALLPDYLQQLDMESNGKRVRRDGGALHCTSAPILWGGVGTNVQHAFFQLLHQGTRLVPVDFIAVLQPAHPLATQHELTLANCFAQSRALMWGRTESEARAELTAQGMPPATIDALTPHRVFAGNTPTNTLLLPRLTPRSLGALLALYEHRTFVQSAIWGINAFDQWGVELGKAMASTLAAEFKAGDIAADLDSSTAGLLDRYRRRNATTP